MPAFSMCQLLPIATWLSGLLALLPRSLYLHGEGSLPSGLVVSFPEQAGWSVGCRANTGLSRWICPLASK